MFYQINFEKIFAKMNSVRSKEVKAPSNTKANWNITIFKKRKTTIQCTGAWENNLETKEGFFRNNEKWGKKNAPEVQLA